MIHYIFYDRIVADPEFDSESAAVLVTGARQVGKSTLLKKVFAGRKYVALDDPFMEQQAREAGEMFLTLNPSPVTIDEVQRAKELLNFPDCLCANVWETLLICTLFLLWNTWQIDAYP